MTEDATVGVSVVICTIGRSEGVLRAMRSAVRDAATAEVIVVDQNESGELANLASRDSELSRVRIVPALPRGLAAARNAGVTASRGAIVLFTDDDCEVQPGWSAGLTGVFSRDPNVGLVFGNVTAPAYDRSIGLVPAYRVPRYFVAHRLAQKPRIEGIGACMAVRRTMWEALGGFDESLGSGARFRAGEEADLVVRALVYGWRVGETPDAGVIHHGFRTWAQGRRLISGYMYGLGAVNAKMLRLGGWRAVRPLTTLAARWLVGAPVVDLNQLPPRLPRLGAFLRGAVLAMHLPMTSDSGVFSTSLGASPLAASRARAAEHDERSLPLV